MRFFSTTPGSLPSIASGPVATLAAVLSLALVLPGPAASAAGPDAGASAGARAQATARATATAGVESPSRSANPDGEAAAPRRSTAPVDRLGTPRERAAAVSASRSVGRASRGELLGGVPFEDAAAARLLPRRHAARGLNFGTQRLVEALHRAAESVRKAHPDSPPLGVGNLSAPKGGPIPRYSRSHQSGRDADLAFYQLDSGGQPLAAVDLGHFDARGRALRSEATFDAERTWQVVRALITDPTIDVQWLFISKPLKALLLAQARTLGEPQELLERAGRILHQPTDSLPHADHLHLRIRCTEEERTLGCVD